MTLTIELTPKMETRREYYALVAKRRTETLTPEEHIRLIALTNTVEIKNAERIAHLAKLAQLRQVSLDDVMKQLGIRPPGYL